MAGVACEAATAPPVSNRSVQLREAAEATLSMSEACEGVFVVSAARFAVLEASGFTAPQSDGAALGAADIPGPAAGHAAGGTPSRRPTSGPLANGRSVGRRRLAGLSVRQRRLKRGFDLAGAMIAVLFFLPAMLAVAIAICVDDGAPILFVQRRRGLNGRPFTILKFRTMRTGSEAAPFSQTARKDPRLTRIGRFLRKTSLDELPQLFNVLAGTMSLVGPRPHALNHERQFEHLLPHYDLRFVVKPGITGLAQVNERRGAVSADEMRDRLRYDIAYIRGWSLALDLLIVLRTAAFCWFHDNAF